MERYTSSKAYYRHPLFPILLIADAALEDYRDIADRFVTLSSDMRLTLGLKNGLANITVQRDKVARLSGDLKTFHASLQSLLDLRDEKNGSAGDPGSPRSVATQARGQMLTPLSSIMQYLVSASGDILETTTAIDTKLQFLFPVVSILWRTVTQVCSCCTDHA